MNNHMIQIAVNEQDYRRLLEKTLEKRITPEDLFQLVIDDLLLKNSIHPYELQQLLQIWFDRCEGYDHKKNQMSFLQHLQFESAIEDYIYWMKEIEDAKRQLQEAIIQLNTYPKIWNIYTDKNGNPSYASEEDYIQIQKEDVEQFTEEQQIAEKRLQEYWEDYLKWEQPDIINQEEEIRDVISWYKIYNKTV